MGDAPPAQSFSPSLHAYSSCHLPHPWLRDSVSPRALRRSNLCEALLWKGAHLMRDQHMTNEPPSADFHVPFGQWDTPERGCAQEAGIHWGTRPAIANCQLGVGSPPKEPALGEAGGRQLPAFNRHWCFGHSASWGSLPSGRSAEATVGGRPEAKWAGRGWHSGG